MTNYQTRNFYATEMLQENENSNEHNLDTLSDEERRRMHDAYSKMGQEGGRKRAEQLGHDGYVEMGKEGGRKRAEQLGHEGYVEMGREGGRARAEQMAKEGFKEKK